MSQDNTTTEHPVFTYKPNRSQRRAMVRQNHSEMVRQDVPLFDKPKDERTGYEVPVGFKTIWHKKFHNMPRAYPGIDRIGEMNIPQWKLKKERR